jgi:hypothetical protein
MIYFRRREKVFILNEEYGHEIRNRYDDEWLWWMMLLIWILEVEYTVRKEDEPRIWL